MIELNLIPVVSFSSVRFPRFITLRQAAVRLFGSSWPFVAGIGLHQFRSLRRITYLKAKRNQLIAQLIGTFPIAGRPGFVALAH
jgi:hypothetical protein